MEHENHAFVYEIWKHLAEQASHVVHCAMFFL